MGGHRTVRVSKRNRIDRRSQIHCPRGFFSSHKLRAAHRAGKLPQLQEASRPRSSRAASPTTFTQEDTDFILGEIREREQFLNQVNKLGRTGAKHSQANRDELEAELAQKKHMYSVMKGRVR